MEELFYGQHKKIGILGGGQLGRMFIQSAISFDVRVSIMEGDQDSPASNIAHFFTQGQITNYQDVLRFGEGLDVLTVEIENVNVDALEELERLGVKVFPQPHILRMIQDKGAQKEFYQQNNIPTAHYKLVNSKEEAIEQARFLPFFQKLRRGGYDGKGVHKCIDTTSIEQGFDAPCVLEKLVDFEKELSVIVARNERGEVRTFPAVECEFSPTLNLVEFLFSPADISTDIERKAEALAIDVIEKLNMVGVLAVELFLTKDGELFVNEIAPRPHNSGHHTIECNFTSQFEQHMRAVLNLPLGSTRMILPGVMVNLIGEEGFVGPAIYEGLVDALKHEGVYFHVYGKSTTKPHRKMAHFTVVHQDLNQAKILARQLKSRIRVVAK
jgi:5-(carboxyamino)imidazole ribonucleotide synthase